LIGGLDDDTHKPSSDMRLALPTDPADALTTDFYMDSFSSKPTLHVQAIIVKAATAIAKRKFLDIIHPSNSCNQILTTSDAIHAGLVVRRSQASRILTADLWYPSNRINARPFRNYMRFMFNLPVLPSDPNDTHVSDTSGCQVNTCYGCKSTHRLKKTAGAYEIDPTGDHASSGCPAAHKARYRSHNGIALTLRNFAREAGLEANTEPPTASLLLDEFSDEECRLMFPKNANAATKQLAAEAGKLALEIKALTYDGQTSKAKFRSQELLQLRRRLSDKVQGRRIDVHMLNPTSHDSRWVDVSGIHPSCKTYRVASCNFVKALDDAEIAASSHGVPNTMTKTCSPRIASAAKAKHATYKLITTLADRQLELGQRSGAHDFIPAIHSHEGELSSAFFNLIEWLTTQYALHTKSLGLTHGYSTKFLTAVYRGRLKDAIFVAIANGFGAMLGAAGLPTPVGALRAGR
jgi:hypothetical protein